MIKALTVFAMVFLAEMGDKTQLFLIGLSSKFKIKSILIGVAAAVAVLNAAAVAVGYFLGGSIDASIIKFAAAAAFLGFAYTGLFPKKDEEENPKSSKRAVLTVFISFILAELGDKTQLMTLTLAADSRAEGDGVLTALLIFAASSIALFAADALGMTAGYFLAKKLPEGALGMISFAVFTFFGIFTFYEAVSAVNRDTAFVVISVASLTLIFAALCAVTLILLKKKRDKEKSVFSGRQK